MVAHSEVVQFCDDMERRLNDIPLMQQSTKNPDYVKLAEDADEFLFKVSNGVDLDAGYSIETYDRLRPAVERVLDNDLQYIEDEWEHLAPEVKTIAAMRYALAHRKLDLPLPHMAFFLAYTSSACGQLTLSRDHWVDAIQKNQPASA